MSKHRIVVLSDTHGMIRPEVEKELKEAEVILHAGDVVNQKTLEKLNSLGKLIVVRGNCDRTLEELPEELTFELFGKKLYMVHDRKKASDQSRKADIVLYGHSHIYNEEEKDGQLWLNPGSAGPRRFGRPSSMAVLLIDENTGEIEVEKIDL